MSLDGVIDTPTWTFDYGFHPRMGEAIGAVTRRSRGILLGRTTYEMFEPAWSTRTVDDDPGAPFFNDTTKYVVSGRLTTATWRNSKLVGPYDADAIRTLKDEVGGDLYVSGSGTLVRAMLADGLVDALHLFVRVRYERVAFSYSFSGFFAPVDNPPTFNRVKAGTAVPVKFSLGGDQGLNIFAGWRGGTCRKLTVRLSDGSDHIAY